MLLLCDAILLIIGCERPTNNQQPTTTQQTTTQPLLLKDHKLEQSNGNQRLFSPSTTIENAVTGVQGLRGISKGGGYNCPVCLHIH